MTDSKLKKEKIDNFWTNRTKIKDAVVATHFKHDETIDFDKALVASHFAKGSRILDLGAGTCRLSSQFLQDASKIVAVDKFKAFLDMAPEDPKLVKIESDLLGFKLEEKFDLILLFGILNYFEADEVAIILKSSSEMLAPGGTLIAKHQCGVTQDVIVDSFSEKIGSEYHAAYRAIAGESKLFSEIFRTSEVIDIYPAKLNPWPNTHFYAFVARNN